MNVIQIIMLITAGSFMSTALVVDTRMKHNKISQEIRSFIGKAIIVLGSVVMVFFTCLLIQHSLQG